MIMGVRLEFIDFDTQSARVYVDCSGPFALVDRIDGLVAECVRCDAGAVTLVCDPALTRVHGLIVQNIARRYHAHTVTRSTCAPDVSRSRNYMFEYADTPAGTQRQFHMEFCGSVASPAYAGASASLAAIASGIPRISSAHLALCTYELAVNSVEHGQLASGVRIRADIRVSGERISLVYRDDGVAFSTLRDGDLDLQRKIERGERRGLGLYLLRGLAGSLDYSRDGNWNVTTLSLRRNTGDKSNQIPNERNTMTQISVEVIPCDVPGTVVVKPAGSIDSSTTSILESQIDSLVAEGIERLVVDLADVEFVSSAGIGVFLGTASQLRTSGGDLAFMNVPEAIAEVFEIINLKNYFRTVQNPSDLAANTPR